MISGPGAENPLIGNSTNVKGRAATIMLHGNIGVLESANEIRVTTVGKQQPTQAEELKRSVIMKVLQNRVSLFDHPLAERIWFPKPLQPVDIPASPSEAAPISIVFPMRQLNPSQTSAVRAILSDTEDDAVVLIHGPPGTGKTTVIAAAVTSLMASNSYSSQTLWLVAHSNVAVKNIAEKLAAADFDDFKLLVSREFKFDWYETLHLFSC